MPPLNDLYSEMRFIRKLLEEEKLIYTEEKDEQTIQAISAMQSNITVLDASSRPVEKLLIYNKKGEALFLDFLDIVNLLKKNALRILDNEVI